MVSDADQRFQIFLLDVEACIGGFYLLHTFALFYRPSFIFFFFFPFFG